LFSPVGSAIPSIPGQGQAFCGELTLAEAQQISLRLIGISSSSTHLSAC
jgi:hypothetical protein